MNSFLQYVLKFLMIPRSKGWSLEVVFAGRKVTFMLLYPSVISGGWQPALSMKSSTDLLSLTSFLLSLLRISPRISPVIQDFFWLQYHTGRLDFLTLLKHLGFFDFQITIGGLSDSPRPFTTNVTVIRCFAQTFVWKSSPETACFVSVPDIPGFVRSLGLLKVSVPTKIPLFLQEHLQTHHLQFFA